MASDPAQPPTKRQKKEEYVLYYVSVDFVPDRMIYLIVIGLVARNTRSWGVHTARTRVCRVILYGDERPQGIDANSE